MNKSKFTTQELSYLKLFTYGYGETQFLEYFNLDSQMIDTITKDIQLKFRVKNWSSLIKKGFTAEILSPKDFVEDSIIEIASNFSIRIYDEHFKKHLPNKKKLNPILYEFMENCSHELEFNRAIEQFKSKNMKLSVKERKLVELMYIGICEERKVCKILEISRNDMLRMKKNVFRTLGTNSWYNTIRRAFQLNILDKKKYTTLNFEDEIEKKSEEIRQLSLRTKKAENQLELKLHIYHKLIELYNTFEYNCLLRKDFEEHKIPYLQNQNEMT
ncbi:MAG: hypothetical protein Aureis2KO_25920 [Aureisphaera sp.]